jgi:hypothetical protein
MGNGGKVIFLGGIAGIETWGRLPKGLGGRFFGGRVSRKRLDVLREELYLGVETGSWEERGWWAWGNGYGLSKLFILSYCRFLGSVGSVVDMGISVYGVCHGLTKEDLDGEKMSRSVEEEAKTVVWLITDKKGGIVEGEQGKFYHDCAKMEF